MRFLAVSILVIFDVGCSSYSEKIGSNSNASIDVGQSGCYKAEKSDFFGEDTFTISPRPKAKDVSDICHSSTTGEADLMKLLCNWASRRLVSTEGEVGNASDSAYWPSEPTRMMVVKLNASVCSQD